MPQLSLDLKYKSPRQVQGIPVYHSPDYQSLEDYQGLGIRVVRERPDLGKRMSVSRPTDLVPFFDELYRGLDKEAFYSFLLDSRNQLQGVDLISLGSLNASLVHPREVFRLPLILSAASLLVSHNHPSGDATPSREDIELTRRLQQGGELLGVELLDHVIYGSRDRFLSMKEANLL